jgi:chemotaxis protein MotB
MADDRPEFIVVRRHRDPGEGRHGGAWKIAFADFMTAMMAFFLVLWIINAKDNPKKLLGRYFAVRVEEPAGAPKGVHEIKSSVQETNGQKIVEANGQEKPGAPINREPSSQRESKSGDATLRDTSASKREDSSQRGALEASEPAANKPTVPESELLSDPYRSLDTIASGDATLTMAPGVDSGSDPTRRAGLVTIDAFSYPPEPVDPSINNHDTMKAGELPPAAYAPQQFIAAKHPATDEPSKASEAAAAGPAARLLKELRDQLGALGKSLPGPAIDVQSTDEGLLISLTDRINFSMFAVGSAEPSPALVKAMESIGKVLREQPGTIVLLGHTDGRAYQSQTYDNWRLSSARAQMAYYMLTRAGVPEARFGRVVGYANRSLKDPAHPLAAENRRIEILLNTAKL